MRGLSIVQSAAARCLFLTSALVTLGILYWAHDFRGGNLAPIFRMLFAVYDERGALWSLGVLVLTVFASAVFPSRRVLRWIGDHPTVVAASTAAVLCLGALLVYRDHPLAMDEYAPYLQSQIFAAGRLSGRFPVALMDWLVPPHFQNTFIVVSKVTGEVTSVYWPSFALLLTPFTALGISWACNPVISAFTLVAAHRLALKIYGSRDAAALVVLLTLASPVFFLDGISYYSMSAHLLANTVFALLLVEPRPTRAVLAGFVGSIALTLHNPVPHILFAMPWILWILARPGGFRLGACLAAGYLPLCAILGVGWFLFTGHVREAGLAASAGGGGLLGRLSLPWVFSVPSQSVVIARLVGFAKVWVWAVPGLVILACVGARKSWPYPALRLLTLSALLTLGGYFFVPLDQGHGWGYRYFHSAWIALPLLAAGALVPTSMSRQQSVFQGNDTRSFVVTCAVCMLLIAIPLRALQVRDFMTWDMDQLPRYPGSERQVVLMRGEHSFYGADLVQNDPWLRGTAIRMLSHGDRADARMMAENFPDFHQVYLGPHGAVWSAKPAAE